MNRRLQREPEDKRSEYMKKYDIQKIKLQKELEPYISTEKAKFYRVVQEGTGTQGTQYRTSALDGHDIRETRQSETDGRPRRENEKPKFNNVFLGKSLYASSQRKGAEYFAAEMNGMGKGDKFKIIEFSTDGQKYIDTHAHKDKAGFITAMAKWNKLQDDTFLNGEKNLEYHKQNIEGYLNTVGIKNREVIINAPSISDGNYIDLSKASVKKYKIPDKSKENKISEVRKDIGLWADWQTGKGKPKLPPTVDPYVPPKKPSLSSRLKRSLTPTSKSKK